MAELARGSVVDRPWGRTLAAIGLRAMSGQLTVYSEQREFAIVFSQGAVVGAYSPLPADSVARVALTAGLLTAHEVTEVSRRQSHDDGTDVVIEVGRLTPDQVARLRRRATAHRAARTFALERGEFVLTDDVTAGWHPDAAVDVRAVIYLGARLTLSESRLASDLGLLGASFRLRDDAVADLPQFGLADLERPVVAALRKGAGLHAVELACPDVDQRTVRSVIYALVCGGAVDAIGELHGQAGAPPARPSAPALPRTRTGSSAAPSGTSSTATAPAMPRTLTPGTQAPAASPPRTAAGSGPRGPSAPPPVHTATARTATGSSRPAPSQRAADPPATSRTATPLPASPTRPPVGRTSTPLDPPRTTTPPPPRVPSTTAPRNRLSSPGMLYNKADVRVPTATGGPPAKNPLAVSEIQSLIKAKTALLDQGADHFLLLGVTPDAPIEVIRGAFYGLVRRIHPDLLVAVGMPVTDDAQRLMARLNEAYAVLNAPDKRAEYERGLHGGDAQGDAASLVAAVLTAEERFRRGHAALKRDDLEEAIREFETALELKKDEGDYLALLTWARFCAAPDKDAAAGATRQALDRAGRMAPESVVPRFWLGRVERILGRSAQALTHFRWVLDQDPRHAEAAAEVRVLMSREPRGPRPRR
jgi:DnaJ domain/Domain of unknown function (DUF4388)